MIVEVLIVSVAAVTIVGTMAGLRFAGRHLERETPPDPKEARAREQREAVELVRQCVERNLLSDRAKVRALLLAYPERLPPDMRARAVAWLSEKPFNVPMR